MTDIIFAKNYEHVVGIEGLYSDNPADSGGETWKGIARNRWPTWEGWPLIDAARQLLGFPQNLALDTNLEQTVRGFYRVHFWDKLACDDISALSARTAAEMFEQAVNHGTTLAGENLQKCLNALNNGGKYYADLAEDGAIGAKTLAALAAFFARRGAEGETVLLRMLNVCQGMHYISLSRHRAKDEAFVYGWFLHRIAI